MKKLLILSVLILGVFTGCGDKDFTSEKYKRDLLKKVYVDNDEKAREEFEQIKQNLADKEEDSDQKKAKKALEEIEKWDKLEQEYDKLANQAQ